MDGRACLVRVQSDMQALPAADACRLAAALNGISVGDIRLSIEMLTYERPLCAQAERHIQRHHYVKTHSPHIQEVDKGACGAYNKQRKAMNGKVSADRS